MQKEEIIKSKNFYCEDEESIIFRNVDIKRLRKDSLDIIEQYFTLEKRVAQL